MIKNVIKTCCCFVDKAVWFVNQVQSIPLWHFDHVKKQTRIEDILEYKFIKEIRTVRNLYRWSNSCKEYNYRFVC